MANINIPSAPNLSKNINQQGSAESHAESFQKSFQAVASTRAVANIVIKTREELVKMLKQQGILLRTKMTVYDATRDFITSSYVIYSHHRNHQEPLVDFINRYPQLKPQVLKINEDLKST
jgi:hypothetical protein